MRVDYYFSGNATAEHVAVDRIVADGPWAGSRKQLIDTLDRGLYQFEVHDAVSDRLLYSRGFCAVFGEWQTTASARQKWGTFHHSLRFPWPRTPVKVILKRRGNGNWREIWSQEIDPTSRFVVQAETPRHDEVWSVFTHGEPQDKVDIVFLGDGYTPDEMKSFHAAVRHLADQLFSVDPFKSRREDFNVRAIDIPASESGVSRPRAGIFRRSPLSCEYNTFDLPRYVLTFNNRAWRDVAAQAPYDYVVILLNERAYGGGGIYNDQAIVVADHAFSTYILIHEFGHHLAGLGDEYYISNVAYETGSQIKREPWEPNITALMDPARLKWKDLVESEVPLPTPWDKAAYETTFKAQQAANHDEKTAGATLSKTKQVSRSQREQMLRLLKQNLYFGKVGAFEGAGYEPHGLYRPCVDCVMFSRNDIQYCPVCRRAIEQVIDLHIH